jgi:hypothetical protein
VGLGMKQGVLVPDAFEDGASLGYGVVFKAPAPQIPWPLNKIAGNALKLAAKFPKIAAKI